MNLNYYLLDVFTNRQFGGNPLAVFPDVGELSPELMQSIASELNLSETTFMQGARSEATDCTVRIFTPKSELPMAGHPTIGTAWTILSHGLLKPRHSEHLLFDEGVGPVRVDFAMNETARSTELVMHQPLPQFGKTMDKAKIAQVLSLRASDIDNDCPIQIVSCGVPVIVVPLKSLDAARRARVRLDLMDTNLGRDECQELLVFTREAENTNADVHCRFFAPRFGIAEDPATGAAHGPLGSYLVKYGLNDGRRIVSEQGIEMERPSTITVRIESDGADITGVLVGGECVEVGTGTIRHCVGRREQFFGTQPSDHRETLVSQRSSTTHYIHGTSPDEQARLRALNRLTNQSFAEFLDVQPGMRILEVGSGLGLLAVEVASAASGVSVVGVELSQEQIDVAQQAPEVKYVQGDAQQLEFPDECFDLTYARYLMEHVADPTCALRKMRRVTRRNGKVIVCENDISLVRVDPPCPTFDNVWGIFQDYQRSLGGNAGIGTSLYRLFREAGFREVELSVQPEVHWHGSSGFQAWIQNLIGNIRGVQLELVETGLCSEETIWSAIRELEALTSNSDASSWFVWNRAAAVC